MSRLVPEPGWMVGRMVGLALVASCAVGCAASHVRGGEVEDGADDAAVPATIGPPCLPTFIPEGGFTRSEVYVETYTPVCGEPPLDGVPTRPPIGVCVVYGLEGDPRAGCTSGCARPEEVAERTFCTCRCGGDPGTGPFCTCAAGTRCEALIAHGGRSGGSFCVPNGLTR